MHPEKAEAGLHRAVYARSFLWTDGSALLLLALSFVVFFKDWFLNFQTKFFLSLDSTVLYQPLAVWVHSCLAQGQLPLLNDNAYHGAPLAAVSMAGVFSPILWLLEAPAFSPATFNLVFLLPHALLLFGAYFLGRRLGLMPTASALIAFLWTYNGQQMAHLDHLNVAWAQAFFPWAFLCFLDFQATRRWFSLLSACLLWALCLLSGHPQLVFLEGLFLAGWTFLTPGGLLRKSRDFGLLVLGTCLFASPLLLFSAECLGGYHVQWDAVDRFFHSWTPLNFVTLLFPWFFGRDLFDRSASDYWWQYQFPEMQVAFSVVGLFFILLYLFTRQQLKKALGLIALFGLLMALGRFFFVYPWVQSLPVFSFFRDPARYWFLITWALGIGAGFAWQAWFEDGSLQSTGKKMTWVLWGLVAALGAALALLLGPAQPLLKALTSWVIGHFLLGDGLHQGTLSDYIARLSQKFAALSGDLDLHQPRVFLPLIFLALTTLVVWNRFKWNQNFQKALLLFLLLADLLAFRMPLGAAFYGPNDIPAPAVPAPQNRSLCLMQCTVSPLPAQYGEMAYPNMNLAEDRPNLVFDANPPLERYAAIEAQLGWFSWVYKGRDPLGFTKHVNLMKMLGVDEVVSDEPLTLPRPFKTLQDRYPYGYGLKHVLPRAFFVDGHPIDPWPAELDDIEKPGFDPFHEAVLDEDPGALDLTVVSTKKDEVIHVTDWQSTHLALSVRSDRSGLLVLQKTYLPGWRAWVNGATVTPLRCDLVLTGIPLSAGDAQVELKFLPDGLRLGLFAFFALMALWFFLGFQALARRTF